PRVLRVRDRVALEADPSRELIGKVREQVALGLDELDALYRSAGLGVAEVAEEKRPVGLDQQRGVGAREADQVADVRRAGNQKGLLERSAKTLQPVGHDS